MGRADGVDHIRGDRLDGDVVGFDLQMGVVAGADVGYFV